MRRAFPPREGTIQMSPAQAKESFEPSGESAGIVAKRIGTGVSSPSKGVGRCDSTSRRLLMSSGRDLGITLMMAGVRACEGRGIVADKVSTVES
jgi:hypothetical protein